MNAAEREVVDDLRFRGRYASETENEAGERRYNAAMKAAAMIEAISAENGRFRAALFGSHANLPLPDGELMAALGPKDSGAKP